MYLGTYQLGQWLPVAVLTTNAALTPVNPDLNPIAEFWNATTKVLSVALPRDDFTGQTGWFRYLLQLSSTFVPGRYRVVYRWKSGSYVGVADDCFIVSPGGNANGAVRAMHFYERPDARFIVYETDAGVLVFGRNPSF